MIKTLYFSLESNVVFSLAGSQLIEWRQSLDRCSTAAGVCLRASKAAAGITHQLCWQIRPDLLIYKSNKVKYLICNCIKLKQNAKVCRFSWFERFCVEFSRKFAFKSHPSAWDWKLILINTHTVRMCVFFNTCTRLFISMQTGNIPPVSTGDVSTVIIIYSWQWLPWRLILPHNSRRGIRRKRFGGSCLCVWLKEIQIERNEDGNADIKACSELKLHHIQRDDRWITHPSSTGNIQNNRETLVDSNFTYAMYKGMFVSGFMLFKKTYSKL